MLLSLHIKNYALIEELRLEFVPELNIFTGETGAGKSIIIDALGLLLGERASAQVLRKGAQRCSVTGEFDVTRLKDVRSCLEEAGVADSGAETILLRRELDATGRSRAFINDRPVSLETVKNVGELLVDVHGQHEHQALFHAQAQRELLDRYGGLEDQVADAGAMYAALAALRARAAAQTMSAQERDRLIDLYSYQKKEIEEARLSADEEEEIERTLPQLKNAEKLIEAGRQAHDILYGAEGSVIENIGKVTRLVENLHSLGGNGGDALENLQKAYFLAEEAARSLEDFTEKLTLDPAALNALLERRDMLQRLKKKYSKTIPEILAHHETVSKELEALSLGDETRQELEKSIAAAEKTLAQSCEKLSAARKKAGEKLAAGVEKELQSLGMKKARFSVNLEKEPEPGRAGQDRLEFMFCANPGEDAKTLKSIASGGEMSRVMLALKTVLAKADRVPVLIFDEIDSGIGGPMGEVIGRKLQKLSGHHQILCITHLPQIAAFGNQNMFVAKEVKAGHTLTRVRTLSDEERIEEIARMLSGAEITPAARQHAAELIAGTRI